MSLGNTARSTSSTRCPLRASSIAVDAPPHRAPITIASYMDPPRPYSATAVVHPTHVRCRRTVPRATSSLAARSVRISLRDVDFRPVVEVRNPECRIVHQPRHARHVVVIDVLRLVGHLMVI